tara:strand:+ start:657 stop:1253 length:597 start_codon:yes stop_codon:yes gene_type:complete
MKVLVACEFSGIVRDAFIERGHDAMSCDLLPSETPGPHYQGDIFDIIDSEDWDLMIAHPPCTHLSVSGARWFPPHTQPNEAGYKPLYLRFEALAFVDRLLQADIPRICVENPLSVISGFIRKADQTIQPYEFGHLESKRTCFWLKGLPKLEPTQNVYDEMMKLPIQQRNRIHWLGSGKGKERSKFYRGIAKAMASQWG